jgi:hypothetical protein
MKFFFALGIVTLLSGALNSNANAFEAIEATLDGNDVTGHCTCTIGPTRGHQMADGTCRPAEVCRK